MNETFLKDFQHYLREEEKSSHTIAAYLGDLRGFFACVGEDRSLESLTKHDILLFKEFLTTKYEVSTRNRKLAALSHFLRFARDAGILIPPIQMKLFRKAPQRLHWYITENENLRLIAEAENRKDWRAAAIFAGLFYSGARASELLQIQSAEATQQMVTIVGKGNIERSLYLSNNILQRTWEKYLETKTVDSCPFLFSGERGKLTRPTLDKIIQLYAGKIHPRLKREKAHAHAFRHGCAMWLKDSGCSIEQVASILGHSSLDTTRIYFQHTTAELLNMMKGKHPKKIPTD